MIKEFLQGFNVNLPFIGTASAGVLLVSIGAIYLLTKRKKSITLRV